MGKQVVGLKVGASSLLAARVSVNGAVEVVQTATGALPSGLVAAGEVRDVDGLALALKDFFGKNKLPKRAVRIGIATNRIGVRSIDIHGIGDPKQLANAVRFRAQEVLPIPLDQAVLDYQVLSEGVDDEGVPTRKVLLVVAYRDLVDGYARACRQAGLRLTGIDLDAFALLRALTPAEPPTLGGERSALVAVAVGAERSTLGVSDGHTCEFTRVLDWGGAMLTNALASQLGIDREEAEQLKTQVNLAEGGEPLEGLAPEQAAQAREILRSGLQALARELVSSLQFYQSQPDSLGIREVVLAGGTAKLGGLAEELQRLIGVAVRVGDPFTTVAVGKKVRHPHDPSLAIPIGLGMAS